METGVIPTVTKALIYAREVPSNPCVELDPEDHIDKYSVLLKTLLEAKDAKAKGGHVVLAVAFPAVLGDNYDEILQNLSLIALYEVSVSVCEVQDGSWRMRLVEIDEDE